MIQLTETAANEVQQILQLQDKGDSVFVRVSIAGGGCSGLRYKLTLDTDMDAQNDVRYDCQGVGIVTTKKFAPFLDGTTIDLGGAEGDERRGFLVENPNYSNIGCPGCGGH